ncbi:MAG: iron ABC transporter substrate-binding protein [Actinomycetota bacterium]|nr:iron ABC transporter substrate-binding protein [Actinomycetota bacterium]
MSQLRASSIFVLLALTLALAGACGQEPPSGNAPSGNGGAGGETAGGATAAGGETTGGGTTGGTTGETTAAAPFRAEEGALVIYSGRQEGLVGPVIEQFEKETGIDAQVRYGDTAELAATIVEEGENSPADVFFAQDPGALGAVADAGAFKELPQETLARVPEEYRSPDNLWVGTSGRARVVAYNTEALQEDELPPSIFDFTAPEWKGRIGWAPTNGSFQAFVTALRAIEGEDRAREWLEGIQANEPIVYPDNSTTLDAVASGEVEVGFVNHYYLYRALDEQGEGFGARNYYLKNGDPGALVIVAGTGILNTADNPDEAQRFVDYLLAEQAQQYFADETYEYPMVEGIQTPEGLVPLREIETPEVDLGDLDDLQGTLELLRETGVL